MKIIPIMVLYLLLSKDLVLEMQLPACLKYSSRKTEPMLISSMEWIKSDTKSLFSLF